MSGITRINITDTINGSGGWRFRKAKRLHNVANSLYRDIFESIGSPLEDGEEIDNCTLDEFKAGYDYILGIDTILRTKSGQMLTMQEKFLFTHYNTLTVEYMQNPKSGELGDWYKLKCQVYFVGYDYPYCGNRFVSWILLNWPQVVIATEQNKLKWGTQKNTRDGARASFKYVSFSKIPDSCIIARGGMWNIEKLPYETIEP
ncbi:unnamed protein product, partial [marine sediment metagenome]